MLTTFADWLSSFDIHLLIIGMPPASQDNALWSDAIPAVIGALAGGLISGAVALYVSRITIKNDRELSRLTKVQKDAALALSGFAKIRRYVNAIRHATTYIEDGVARAKEEGLPEDQYMQMMGGLLGDLGLPNRLEASETMFLYKPGNQDLINRLNDLEELAISLNQLVFAFSEKNIEFGRMLMESHSDGHVVVGKSVDFQRPKGEVNILEIHLKDMLKALIETIEQKPVDEDSVMLEYIDAAHAKFGSHFPKMTLQPSKWLRQA